MAELKEKRLFLLDMDGTIYLDNDLFPGTIPFLRWVRETGGTYLLPITPPDPPRPMWKSWGGWASER